MDKDEPNHIEDSVCYKQDTITFEQFVNECFGVPIEDFFIKYYDNRKDNNDE